MCKFFGGRRPAENVRFPVRLLRVLRPKSGWGSSGHCRYPITSLDHSSEKCLETHELIPFCSKPNRVPNGTLPGTGTPSIGAGGPAGGRPGRSSPGVAVGSLWSCGERAGRPQDPLRVSATDARCRASGNPDAAGKGCQPRPRAGRVPALPAAAEGGRRRSRNAHTRGPAGPARMCDKNLISREKYFLHF